MVMNGLSLEKMNLNFQTIRNIMKTILKIALLKIRHPKAGVFVRPIFRYKMRCYRFKGAYYVKNSDKIFVELK